MRSRFVLLPCFLFAACAAPVKDDYSSLPIYSMNTCESLADITSGYTPVALYKGVAQCVKEENYTTAVALFAAGGTYGYFDTKRVRDKSAHQAITVLKMFTLPQDTPKEVKETFTEALNANLDQGSPSHQKLCADLKKLGAPTYYPSYMVNHGAGKIAAALNGKAAEPDLVDDFSAADAWEEALDVKIHCSNK